MKYASYLFLLCVVLSILYACKKKIAIPAQFDEGEILFRTLQKSHTNTDTFFTLLIIKKNKVKTVYLHQRPHFATVRNLNHSAVQHIYLENKQRKVFLIKDTLPKKILTLNLLTKIPDTLFWNSPVSRYHYSTKDTVFSFTILKNTDISALYAQDLSFLQGMKLDKFPVQVMLKTAQKQINMYVIRIEQKDIADIEFEYP
jgi:hypothetical protein